MFPIKKRKKEQLEYIIIFFCILSGSLLDLSELFYDMPYGLWETFHFRCRELKLLGFSLLCFKLTHYKKIKLKALTFMFAMWSTAIIVYNSTLYDIKPYTLSIPLYSLYLWWLIRIAFIKKEDLKDQTTKIKLYEASGIAYNILLPVKTFRGLLQILFVPWKNPLYETRLLVANHKIIGIKNKYFVETEYNNDYMQELSSQDFKIKECVDYKKGKVEKLIGKRLILGFNDCKKLEM